MQITNYHSRTIRLLTMMMIIHHIIRDAHVVISVHMSVVLLLTYFPPHTNLC